MTTLDQAIALLQKTRTSLDNWANLNSEQQKETLTDAAYLERFPMLSHPQKMDLRGKVHKVVSLVEANEHS